VRSATGVDNLGRVSSLVVIWSVLLLVALLALGWVILPAVSANRQRKQEDAARRAAASHEQLRYAEEIAVAAMGAASTAEHRRAEYERAQERVAETWRSYQQAEAVLTRARRASAFVSLEKVDPADRERALRRAARAAHRRGDLSDEQLLDALTHRNGWDPRLHPVEQELVIAKAAVRHHAELHRRAVEAEAEAWRADGIATAALQTLRHELLVARHSTPAVPVELQETVVLKLVTV
jgi:hypothetical protein